MAVIQLYNAPLNADARTELGTLPQSMLPASQSMFSGSAGIGVLTGSGGNRAYVYVGPDGKIWGNFATATANYSGQVVVPLR